MSATVDGPTPANEGRSGMRRGRGVRGRSARGRSRRVGWPQVQAALSQLLLTVAVLAMAWRTIGLSFAQGHAVVLPGALLLAPVAAACVVLVNKMPVRALPFDAETDLIVCFMFAVLGLWFLYWTPERFGVIYWLWRPDLFALGLGSLALIALVIGSGAVLYLGLPVIAATLAMCPLGGLILSQHSDGQAAVAVVSAVAAVLPILVSRPFSFRARAWQLAFALIGAVLALAAGKGAHLSTSMVSIIAAAAALVLVESSILLRSRGPRGRFATQGYPRGARGAKLVRFRVLATIVVALAFGALDALIPSFAAASGNSTAAVIVPATQPSGTLTAPGGVKVVAWHEHHLAAASHPLKAELITATGPSAAAVLTYPVQSLINWIGAPCPANRSYTVAGHKVSATEYADNQAGTSWDLFTWIWHSRAQYQRVTLVLAYGLQGHAAQLPKLTGDGAGNGIDTAGLFVANRHIECFDGPQNRSSGLAAASGLIRSVS